MATKERVLAALEAHRGEPVSGEQLAEALSLSRNAVWKAVNELRRSGYRITAATNRGYCLAEDNDILSAEGIAPLLSPTAKPFAGLVHFYPTLTSTNLTAKELALAGAPHGTTVIAETQTGGRGRYTRSFFSPKGGLYISIILHPDRLHFSEITSVTAFSAVAVCDAIQAVSGRIPQIKWVNDVFLDGRKVCGILTEGVTDLETGSLGWIVVGIGINAVGKQTDFPPELREIVTTVFEEAPASGIRCRLAAELINRIAGCDPMPKESALYENYRKRLMMLGQTVTVVQGERTYPALAVDIDNAGHLILQTADGKQTALSSGEIRILPPTATHTE